MVVDQHADVLVKEVKSVVVVSEELIVIPAEESFEAIKCPGIVIPDENEVAVSLPGVGLKEEEVDLASICRSSKVCLVEIVSVKNISTDDGSQPSVLLIDVA